LLKLVFIKKVPYITYDLYPKNLKLTSIYKVSI